jgi:putative membrane protein
MLEERPPQYFSYADFEREEMILRDFLAADRTMLANERTFLSYTRTALAFVIGGASMIHFLSGILADVGGGALIVAGAIALAVGVQRYRWFRKRISVLSRPPTDPETRAILLAHRDNYQI